MVGAQRQCTIVVREHQVPDFKDIVLRQKSITLCRVKGFVVCCGHFWWFCFYFMSTNILTPLRGYFNKKQKQNKKQNKKMDAPELQDKKVEDVAEVKQKRKYEKITPKEPKTPKIPKVKKEKPPKPVKLPKEKVAKNTVCTICEKKFNCYATFYSHLKTKHREPCIKCLHCNLMFSCIQKRNSHYYRAVIAPTVTSREEGERSSEDSEQEGDEDESQAEETASLEEQSKSETQ